MLWTLIEKEVRAVLTSPKFAATFAVCSALILLSFAVGVSEYFSFSAQQAAAQALLDEELAEAASWSEARPRAFRPAEPLQVLVAGVHNDIGRMAPVAPAAEAKLDRSVYSDDPILALFRGIDLALVVASVLSLLAILFTYDAVSGERERGTLLLVLANPLPRSRLILGKLLGTWLGLVLPLSLPLLLGLLTVVLAGIDLSPGQWQRAILIMLAAALYFTLFVVLGIAVSTLCKRSSIAFLTLLAIWVAAVLVVPRASLTAAAHLRPVPSAAEIASRKAAFENAQWQEHTGEREVWRHRSAELEQVPEEEREAYEEEHLWQWMEEDEARRGEVEERIADHGRRLDEELRNLTERQASLAFALSRLSPAATFELAAMRLAGTDPGLKERTEEAMRGYQQELGAYLEAKAGEGALSRRIVVRRRGSGAHFNFGDQDQPAVDVSDMPGFVAPSPRSSEIVASVIPDLGLLAGLCLLGFAVAFVGFLRADVR